MLGGYILLCMDYGCLNVGMAALVSLSWSVCPVSLSQSVFLGHSVPIGGSWSVGLGHSVGQTVAQGQMWSLNVEHACALGRLCSKYLLLWVC